MSASSSQAREYLELLPRSVHAELYKVPSSVLAIFKFMLPPLAKTIVTTMLYMPTPFPATDLDAWFREDAKKDKTQAISVLETLHIISQKQDANRSVSYDLLPAFRKSLRQAFEGSGDHGSFGVPASRPGAHRKVDIAFLDKYARTQWENILFYMVGSTVGLSTRGSGGQDVHAATKKLLEIGDFIAKRGSHITITRNGFTFVLQDTNTQVWSLLIVYLKSARQLNMSETDVLSFLFMLSCLELGQDYSTATLTPTQLQLLVDLSNLGIIYRDADDSPTFYPTRLAVTLTSAAPALLDEPSADLSGAPSTIAAPAGTAPTTAASKGFIIVETNYRLYAYTSSLLSIAILSLFTKLSTRFPNMVSGKLTKDSIQSAVSLGISSSQIITYLTSHAHPQMQKSTPFLPPTVMDQIRLWEYEGERVEASQPGFLMKDFGSEAEWRELVGYAEALGVVVWKDEKRRVFFVERMEMLQGFLQRRAQKGRGE